MYICMFGIRRNGINVYGSIYYEVDQLQRKAALRDMHSRCEHSQSEVYVCVCMYVCADQLALRRSDFHADRVSVEFVAQRCL